MQSRRQAGERAPPDAQSGGWQGCSGRSVCHLRVREQALRIRRLFIHCNAIRACVSCFCAWRIFQAGRSYSFHAGPARTVQVFGGRYFRDPGRRRLQPGDCKAVRHEQVARQGDPPRRFQVPDWKPVFRIGGAMNVPLLQRRPTRPGQLPAICRGLPALRGPAHPVHPAHFAPGAQRDARPLPGSAGRRGGEWAARAGDTAHGEAAGVAGDAARSNPATRIIARTAQDWKVTA